MKAGFTDSGILAGVTGILTQASPRACFSMCPAESFETGWWIPRASLYCPSGPMRAVPWAVWSGTCPQSGSVRRELRPSFLISMPSASC